MRNEKKKEKKWKRNESKHFLFSVFNAVIHFVLLAFLHFNVIHRDFFRFVFPMTNPISLKQMKRMAKKKKENLENINDFFLNMTKVK